MILKFGFYNPIYLACSYLHVLNKNFWKFILEFSGLFYCSIIKVPGLYPTFFTLTFLYQCYWLAVCVSDIYLITFALACQELFYFIFWSLSKNKTLEIFLISCFRTSKKLYAFTLCFLSLFATAICILQHFFDIVKNFFHLISSFSNETKLLFVVQSLNRDNR